MRRMARFPWPTPMRVRQSEKRGSPARATVASWMGSTHFLMRRLKNVRTEMALNVLAYNIKRMVTLVGIKRLMAAIPA